VVLDVGCGAGVDVFSASRRVGQLGHVIGVDMTLEMILKARQLAEKYDYKNVDFRLGEAERLPVETKTVDVVISNCVLNMVPDKLQALEEMHRVLRRRGTLSMTDVIATHTQPRQRNTDPLDWAASAVGAITVIAYVRLLRKAGFQRIHAFDEESVRNKLQIQSSVQVNAMAFLASKP
jgi:ubiquinone/menaquinone biosynthesis C-methylase UbiE